MSKLVISDGDVIHIELEGTDGSFAIHFNSAMYPNQIVVEETAGLKGNVKGGALEMLYIETFGVHLNAEDVDCLAAEEDTRLADAQQNAREALEELRASPDAEHLLPGDRVAAQRMVDLDGDGPSEPDTRDPRDVRAGNKAMVAHWDQHREKQEKKG